MLIILIIVLAIFGAYLEGGGWAENLGSVYRNYRQSRLSKKAFFKLFKNNLKK